MKSNAKEQTHCDNFNDINAHTLSFRDDRDVIRHGRHFVVLRLLTSRLNAAFVVFGTVKLWNDGLTFLVRRVRMLGRKWSINGDLTVSVMSSFKHIPSRQILAPPPALRHTFATRTTYNYKSICTKRDHVISTLTAFLSAVGLVI